MARRNFFGSAAKKKRAAQYKVLIAIVIFFAVASISTVYAARTGWLVIQGKVARTQNMSLRFSNAEFIGGIRNGESVNISTADDHRSINIVSQLMMPGDSRAIRFHIENNGNQAARILNLSANYDSEGTGLVIRWPDEIEESANLEGTVIVPGAQSDDYLIYLYWDAAATDVPSGVFRNFTITFDYQNAML